MMFWIASGITDQKIMFKVPTGAVPAVVEGIKDGAAVVTFTTPTFTANASLGNDGTLIYELLLDELTTLAANNITEHVLLVVSGAGMPDTIVEYTIFDEDLIGVNLTKVLGAAISAGGSAPGGGPIGET